MQNVQALEIITSCITGQCNIIGPVCVSVIQKCSMVEVKGHIRYCHANSVMICPETAAEIAEKGIRDPGGPLTDNVLPCVTKNT